MLNVSLVEDPDSSRVLMSEETHRELGLLDSIELHYGRFKKGMSIVTDDAPDSGTILIPRRLTDQFSIPNLPYETRLEGNSLHLGPVIGFMNNILFYDNPHWIKTRFVNSREIKGLILIFAPRHVDTRRRLIHGKYYDPGSDSFIEVTVPYPTAIFLRTDPPIRLYRHLKVQLGARSIYNYPFRNNKWEFWRCARKYPEVIRHLPETREYVALESVLDMLRKHSAVYLKPYTLSRGRGIYRLSRERKGYLLSDTYDHTWTIPDNSSLEQLLREKLRRNYLVQQEIPFTHQGHKLDYRFYLQKNEKMEWELRGLDARLAVRGSIISNLRKRYDTPSGEDGIQAAYGLDKTAVSAKIAEVTRVCITALKAMEDCGHVLGDVAIDLVLDKDQRVWLLEVQPDYSADVFKIRKEYYAATIHPHCFDYAKALTGF